MSYVANKPGKPQAKRRKVNYSHPQSDAADSSVVTAGQAVSQAKLPWSTVALPGEALASGGFTENDFFDGLDHGSDDFMGLKEVEGVQVLYQDEENGGKTVKFVMGAGGSKRKVPPTRETVAASDINEAPQVDSIIEKKQNNDKRKAGKRRDSAEEVSPIHMYDTSTTANEAADSKANDVPLNDHDWKTRKDAAKPNLDHHLATPSSNEEAALAGVFSASVGQEIEDEDLDATDFDDSLLPAWQNLGLHGAIKRGLSRLSFVAPSAIQAATIPYALGCYEQNVTKTAERSALRDIVGIAQTGSGKTLAYGLPILQYLLEQRNELASFAGQDQTKPLTALVLAPTRELALQVSDHLQKVTNAIMHSTSSSSSSTTPRRYFAQIATVCGGISIQKQRRHLERGGGADIIIATPGRLWELLSEDDELARRVKGSRFLVMDEADRMIETGHFKEMESILALLKLSQATPAEVNVAGGNDEIQKRIASSALGGRENMQTFVFSATLSKELQRNLKKGHRRRPRKGQNSSTLDDLMDRIDFRDSDPLIVDLSPDTGVAVGLTEAKVECLNTEKDLYLYYFLLRYPGRTLVFVNSIDSIRRLHPILANVGVNVVPLHSQLQQKQRLKHLDRFRSNVLSKPGSGSSTNMLAGLSATRNSSCVLLATDVAARGLDIPAVDHVIHYQIPRSADTYVHRSGRTARAGKSGVAIALVEPSEKRLWRDLCRSLKKSDDTAILPVEYSLLPPLRERITLARQIDQAQHKQSKMSHDSAWLRDLAEDADLDITSDLELSEDDDGARKLTDPMKGGKAAQAVRSKVARLRLQLEDLLARPLSARGVSHRYLTSGSTGFVDDLITDSHHQSMIGITNSTAQSDLDHPRSEVKVAHSAAARKKKTGKALPSSKSSVSSKERRAATGKKRKRAGL